MRELTELPIADPAAEFVRGKSVITRAPLAVRAATTIAIVIPLLGVVAAPFFVWRWGFGWSDLVLLVSMSFLTGLGITVGFHRLFVHRSFDTHIWIKIIWAVLGSMAVQGSLFDWVAFHRRHHQFSDTADDPHSPRHEGCGVIGLLKGFWHAHIGWFFKPKPPDLMSYVPDLRHSPALVVVSRFFGLWVAWGLIMPAVLGGLLTMSWAGAWTGLIWGGLVRVFLVHHVTWSVNSACHLWGTRPYASNDESRNNFLFGILALGEGWHNTHHAFPSSARHGLHWWQIDASYCVIRSLELLGLAWDVKLPKATALMSEHRTNKAPLRSPGY